MDASRPGSIHGARRGMQREADAVPAVARPHGRGAPDGGTGGTGGTPNGTTGSAQKGTGR